MNKYAYVFVWIHFEDSLPLFMENVIGLD